MISILLMILKIIGIAVLVLLGTVLVLVLLVLFVPVRYRITVHRRTGEETPFSAGVKVTWLLHIVNAVLSYPEALYLRVRVFCFTVYRSDREKKASDRGKTETGRKKKTSPEDAPKSPETAAEDQLKKDEEGGSEGSDKRPGKGSDGGGEEENCQNCQETEEREEEKRTISDFMKKIISLLKNIKYTIIGICDKIKHIVKNIRYYIEILKSDTFRRAWAVCSGEAISLLRHILPGEFTGSVRIGTGDPASTGEVLAVYGILYPLLGNHIDITPDFEERVVEGDLLIRGRITVFRALKTAWILFFNKDLRRLIKLFKREAV